TGDAQAGLLRLAVVRRIELLLGQRSQQEAQSLQLHGSQKVLEQAAEIVDRNDLAARDIAQLGPLLQEDRRGELRQECLRKVEVNIEAAQTRELLDLHLREDLPTRRLL